MPRIENRALLCVRRALALGVATLACAAFAQGTSGAPAADNAVVAAPAASPAAAAEAAAVRKLLEQKFPGADVRYVAKSGYLGLYEAMLDDSLVYTDPKVAYIFVGSMYDTATKRNLTEARSRKLNRVAVDKLPYELSFKRVKGDGSRKLIIFSDADCPFCHRLENELKGVDNVTIYTFLFPIDQLHPEAARKSRQIWCSADRAKAWDEFFESGKLPDNKGECSNPVAATQALGAKLKIQATPTMILADGTVVPGAIPLARLESEIKDAEAEVRQKPAPAAKK